MTANLQSRLLCCRPLHTAINAVVTALLQLINTSDVGAFADWLALLSVCNGHQHSHCCLLVSIFIALWPPYEAYA